MISFMPNRRIRNVLYLVFLLGAIVFFAVSASQMITYRDADITTAEIVERTVVQRGGGGMSSGYLVRHRIAGGLSCSSSIPVSEIGEHPLGATIQIGVIPRQYYCPRVVAPPNPAVWFTFWLSVAVLLLAGALVYFGLFHGSAAQSNGLAIEAPVTKPPTQQAGQGKTKRRRSPRR